MRLRGTDFGPVFDASGVEGFFGEGYPHNRILKPLGCNFTNSTFVAKTTTLNQRAGNMPMQQDGRTPKEIMPRCIVVKFRAGVMLNAVGLSGPGAEALFSTGLWQKRTKPFFISFMSVDSTPQGRIFELKKFIKIFALYLPRFQSKVGLQINFTCPNVGLDLSCLVDEARSALGIASVLGIPLMPKFNVITPVKAVKAISEDPNCDSICTSNTVPWGAIPEKINWEKIFGSKVSPLEEFGGGGLSGAPLLPLVATWIHEARSAGIKKPINAGGGILCKDDLNTLYAVGATSVFVGSVATLRPWRVKGIIERGHRLFHNGNGGIA